MEILDGLSYSQFKEYETRNDIKILGATQSNGNWQIIYRKVKNG